MRQNRRSCLNFWARFAGDSRRGGARRRQLLWFEEVSDWLGLEEVRNLALILQLVNRFVFFFFVIFIEDRPWRHEAVRGVSGHGGIVKESLVLRVGIDNFLVES